MSTTHDAETPEDTDRDRHRPPNDKLSLFPLSLARFVRKIAGNDGRTYERDSWVISRQYVDRQGNKQFANLTLFPEQIPLLQTLLSEVARKYLIRVETNAASSEVGDADDTF